MLTFEAKLCRTDTVLNALEEYMECSIPGACKGARSMDERKQNLAAVVRTQAVGKLVSKTLCCAADSFPLYSCRSCKIECST